MVSSISFANQLSCHSLFYRNEIAEAHFKLFQKQLKDQVPINPFAKALKSVFEVFNFEKFEAYFAPSEFMSKVWFNGFHSEQLAASIIKTKIMIDKLLLGPLSLVFEFKNINEDIRVKNLFELEKKKEVEAVIESFNKSRLRSAKESREIVTQILKENFNLQDLGENHVVIESPKIIGDKIVLEAEKDVLYQALRTWMMLKYFHTVSHVYYTNKMETKDYKTASVLMDEFYSYLSDGKPWTMRLVFKREIFDAYTEYFSGLFERLKAGETKEATEKLLNDLKNASDPFFPVAGIVNQEPLPGLYYDKSLPLEIKRYFLNPDENPFHIEVQSSKIDKSKYKDSVQVEVFKKAVQSLPVGSIVETRAHSKLHLRLHKRYGVRVVQTIKEELYGDLEIYVLQGTREEVLEALAKLN